jgi:hypothetical protein
LESPRNNAHERSRRRVFGLQISAPCLPSPLRVYARNPCFDAHTAHAPLCRLDSLFEHQLGCYPVLTFFCILSPLCAPMCFPFSFSAPNPLSLYSTNALQALPTIALPYLSQSDSTAGGAPPSFSERPSSLRDSNSLIWYRILDSTCQGYILLEGHHSQRNRL